MPLYHHYVLTAPSALLSETFYLGNRDSVRFLASDAFVGRVYDFYLHIGAIPRDDALLFYSK